MMKQVNLSLETAKKMYNSEDESLKNFRDLIEQAKPLL